MIFARRKQKSRTSLSGFFNFCKQCLLGSVAGATREESRQTAHIWLIGLGQIGPTFASRWTAAAWTTLAWLARFAFNGSFGRSGSDVALRLDTSLARHGRHGIGGIDLWLLLLWTLAQRTFTTLALTAFVPIIAIVPVTALGTFGLLLRLSLVSAVALPLLVAFTLLALLLHWLGRSKARVHIWHIIVEIIIRRLAITLPALSGLRGSDDAEVVLGVLKIILCHHRVAARLRVAGQLEIFFGDMGGIAANLHVRTGALEIARQRINVLAATIATALPVLVILIIGSHLVALSNFRNISVTLLADRLLPDLANP